MKNIPIITCCDGDCEITSALQFAEHVPSEFKYKTEIMQKGIHRCFIIFYDNPELNKFLSNLKVVFLFHAGSIITKVFEYKNSLIAISPLGAPAAANLMEELSVFGIDEFIAIGSAGCLDAELKDKFILVSKAIRDEGLSYHYLKPTTYVSTNKELNFRLEDYLKKKGFKYKKAVTWTNDAYYRETKQKIEMAKKLKAVAVEMECAAWCAVAKYRGFKFSQLLYFSDLLKQEAWSRLIECKEGYHNDKRDVVLIMVKEMIDEYFN